MVRTSIMAPPAGGERGEWLVCNLCNPCIVRSDTEARHNACVASSPRPDTDNDQDAAWRFDSSTLALQLSQKTALNAPVSAPVDLLTGGLLSSLGRRQTLSSVRMTPTHADSTRRRCI